MSCTIHYVTRDGEPGMPRAAGNLPAKPMPWSVSVWMINPRGEKNTHSFEVARCTHRELIPYITGRIKEIAEENGQRCDQFGWTASAHGGHHKPRKSRR